MQSQRDQVQAHLFVMSRLTSGILRTDPDAPGTPTGRTLRGSLGGLAIAALLAGGAVVYGLVDPGGNTSWAKNGTLVVAKDTGADYLYLDGALHPVLNETSARLLAGAQMTVADVSSSSLVGAALGAPVGIMGAPASLPASADLADGPWLACATEQTSASGAATPLLTVAVEQNTDSGGLPGTQLAAGQGLLVATPDGATYLLWHGERLRVDMQDGVLTALGYTAATPYPVSATFVNALPSGSDLAPPVLAGLGDAGPEISGRATRIGQLFTGSAGQQYVLTSAGLEQVTALQYALLLGDPQIQAQAYAGQAVTVGPVGAQDLLEHLVSAPASALPTAAPVLVAAGQDQAVCAETQVAGASAPGYGVALLPAADVAGTAPALEPGDEPSCAGADRVMVPSGHGALVRALSGGGVGQTEYLVTDSGVKYPLAAASVPASLGYPGAPVSVPAGLLALLPTGPSLDPAALAAGGISGPSGNGGACPSSPA